MGVDGEEIRDATPPQSGLLSGDPADYLPEDIAAGDLEDVSDQSCSVSAAGVAKDHSGQGVTFGAGHNPGHQTGRPWVA